MPSRTFVGSDGAEWRAWDVVPDRHPDWPVNPRSWLPAGMATGWLCFESPTEKRRVHPIPRGWETWSDEALRGQCLNAAPVAWRKAALDLQEELPPMTGTGQRPT